MLESRHLNLTVTTEVYVLLIRCSQCTQCPSKSSQRLKCSQKHLSRLVIKRPSHLRLRHYFVPYAYPPCIRLGHLFVHVVSRRDRSVKILSTISRFGFISISSNKLCENQFWRVQVLTPGLLHYKWAYSGLTLGLLTALQTHYNPFVHFLTPLLCTFLLCT